MESIFDDILCHIFSFISDGKTHLRIRLTCKKFLASSTKAFDPSGKNNVAIKWACCVGKIECFKSLIKDARIDIKQKGNSLLKVACRYGHSEIVRELLKDTRFKPFINEYSLENAQREKYIGVFVELFYADLIDGSVVDNEMFELACAQGHSKFVEKLLKSDKIDPCHRKNFPHEENTALYNACSNGHLEVLQILLKDQRIKPSNISLRIACENGHLAIVQELIKDGRIVPSHTELRGAINFGNLEIVKELLKHGKIHPMEQKNLEYTPFEQSIQRGHLKIFKEFLNDNRTDPSFNNNRPLLISIESHEPEIMVLLLKDSRVTAGERHICKAASEGNVKIVRELLKLDSINPGCDENYPIYVAAENGHSDVVKLLLNHPKVDPTSNSNRAIKFAVIKRNLNAAKVLLEDKRVFNTLDPSVLFTTACVCGIPTLAEKLLPQVDPSKEENYAITKAASDGHLDLVKVLLSDKRVNPAAKNNRALRRACKNHHKEVVIELLKDPRVDPSASNNKAIKRACKKNDLDILAGILDHPNTNEDAINAALDSAGFWTKHGIKKVINNSNLKRKMDAESLKRKMDSDSKVEKRFKTK